MNALETRLFPDTHPEFLAEKWPTFHDNRVGGGSGRILRGAVTRTWLDH